MMRAVSRIEDDTVQARRRFVFVIRIPEDEKMSVHCCGIGHEGTVGEQPASGHGDHRKERRTKKKKLLLTHFES